MKDLKKKKSRKKNFYQISISKSLLKRFIINVCYQSLLLSHDLSLNPTHFKLFLFRLSSFSYLFLVFSP